MLPRIARWKSVVGSSGGKFCTVYKVLIRMVGIAGGWGAVDPVLKGMVGEKLP